MHSGKLVFAQLMAHLPLTTFRRCVAHYQGQHKVKSFSCLDQFLTLAFAQLTYRERFRETKAAVKLHTLLDLRGNIPSFLHITDGKVHDVNVLDLLVPEAGAFYVVDRGYVDFARLARFDALGAFFVTRAKSNFRFTRLAAQAVDKSTGLICDQSVALTVFYSKQGYSKPLRRIRYRDPVSDKRLAFLTNHFGLPALTVCELYRMRWQVELFFKWIKQHLRIKSFYGTTENAVKVQILAAVSVNVL